MKSKWTVIALTLIALLGSTTAAFANVHIRGSSENGEDSNVINWLLLARSHGITLSVTGKTAVMRREIVCPSQDVEASLTSPNSLLSGSCDGGAYLFIVQLQSTSTNLSLTFGNLQGFDPTNANNFGVMVCDSASNTLELCTTDPNDPTHSKIPNITVTMGKGSITFTVPNVFPTYLQGKPAQGRGLTFYVLTQQSSAGVPSPIPVGVPTVTIQ